MTRGWLLDVAHKDPNAFNSIHTQSNQAINIYRKTILDSEFYEHATDTEREAEIRKNWADFLENDLPRIDAALKQEDWIWESEESEDLSDASERFVWGDGDISFRRKPDEDHE